jgi:hypothetical protein
MPKEAVTSKKYTKRDLKDLVAEIDANIVNDLAQIENPSREDDDRLITEYIHQKFDPSDPDTNVRFVSSVIKELAEAADKRGLLYRVETVMIGIHEILTRKLDEDSNKQYTKQEFGELVSSAIVEYGDTSTYATRQTIMSLLDSITDAIMEKYVPTYVIG